MKNRFDIATYWHQMRNGYVTDLNKIECFCCGRPMATLSGGTLEQRWNTAKLERAHIVGRSLGGSDEVHNVVNLCSYCHRKAPDLLFPELFHHWLIEMKKIGFLGMAKNDIFPVCQTYDICEIEFFHVLNDEGFKKWVVPQYTIHHTGQCVGHLKTSTAVALAKQYTKNFEVKKEAVVPSTFEMYKSIVENIEWMKNLKTTQRKVRGTKKRKAETDMHQLYPRFFSEFPKMEDRRLVTVRKTFGFSQSITKKLVMKYYEEHPEEVNSEKHRLSQVVDKMSNLYLNKRIYFPTNKEVKVHITGIKLMGVKVRVKVSEISPRVTLVLEQFKSDMQKKYSVEVEFFKGRQRRIFLN